MHGLQKTGSVKSPTLQCSHTNFQEKNEKARRNNSQKRKCKQTNLKYQNILKMNTQCW